MKKPKIRELIEAVKNLIRGPYTLNFPAEPSPPAPTFRGMAEFHEQDCIGCGACAQVCPSKTIEILDDPEARKRKLVLHYDCCNFCGQCQAACPTGKGIQYSTNYDTANFDRHAHVNTVEKELAMCEICGGVVAPYDQLTWIAAKIGPLAFANPTLILAEHRELGLVDGLAERMARAVEDREDLMRILCPRCRREVYIKEEWSG